MKASILSKSYDIIEIPNASAPDFMGTNDRDHQTITVVKTMGAEQREDTLLHEAIHVIDFELRIGLQEEQVARLAVGLYSAGCRLKLTKG